MSQLREFLDGQPYGSVTSLAARLGVTRVYLHQLAARQDGRQPSAQLALRIERETGISRRHLRTDWAEIWPDHREDGPSEDASTVAQAQG